MATDQPPQPEQLQHAGADNDNLFDDIDPTQRASEIESLCMQCGEQGVTRLLLTRIPHFKEVVLMAFDCPHCGYRNNEIQSAGAIAEKGCTYTCHVSDAKDLNRQIVRSEFATVRVPALDFEVPPTSEHGSLTTIEGFMRKCMDDLQAGQPQRATEYPEQYRQIQTFLDKLDAMVSLETPFDLVIDDPSGNSYIENLHLPKVDPKLQVKLYVRSAAQNVAIGLPEDEAPIKTMTDDDAEDAKEVYVFPSICSSCHRPTDCKMHPINIPYFKEVIIMATSCDYCGYRTSEVKSGGAIEPKGKRIELKITDPEDMARDVLKSDSAKVIVPEIELELASGTLGGRFTTIEGLLELVHDEMKANPFLHGDTARDRDQANVFLSRLKQFIAGEIKGTFVVDDPLGCSYLQNIYAPDPDPNMTITEYERTWEDNEMFGLNDTNTETYKYEDNDDAQTTTGMDAS